MSDPLEDRLRSLMRENEQSADEDDQRLERVLHKAHMRSGLFDLLTLFSRWGLVLSEAGLRRPRSSYHQRSAVNDRNESE